MKKLLCVVLVFFYALGVYAMEDVAPVIEVDSAETLATDGAERSYTSYGEWVTDGNFDGWSVNNSASSAVSAGIVTATENTGGDALALEYSFNSGPQSANLDYGYKEFLEIRCKIPAGYTGGMTFQYKTTMNSGQDFSDATSFSIPAGTLIADGAFHTYLLDLGLQRRFRGDLRGLKIMPFSDATPAGRVIEIDYVRLGDLASDVLGVNTDLNFYSGESIGDCSSVQSKHFVIWWSPHTDVIYAGTYGPFADLTNRHRTCLRMLEETYQLEYKVLGYPEPMIDTDGSTPGRFKFAVTTFHEGGWMSNYRGFNYNNFGPPDMQYDTATNPIRHEYGHGVQGTCKGFLNGRHWESHNGYMHVSQMDYWGEVQDGDSGYPYLPFMSWVNYVPKCVHQSNLQMEWRGFVYADRRPYWYLDFDPDNLGFGEKFSVKMWETGNKDEFFHTALQRELPAGVDYEDVTLGWGRRWRTFDIFGGEDKRTWYFHNSSVGEATKLGYLQQHTMLLAACPDKSNTWYSTYGTSPMKMGCSQYELEYPAGGTATVTLRMCDLPGSSEGLRWCLAAANTGYLSPQTTRYSEIWGPNETHSFSMQAGESNLYLVVAGTPNPIDMDLQGDESAYNHNKHPLKLCYQFEAQLTGTRPKSEPVEVYTRTPGGGAAHSNGGGFVENSANVASSVYVGPNARVLGSATISGTARIEGRATVIDSRVQDSARISGKALVIGSGTTINGEARVRDRALVRAGADLSGNALLSDHAKWISGLLTDNAIARGQAWTYGSPTIGGHAILDAEYVREWNFDDGVHKGHYPWDPFLYHYEDFSELLKKPVGLVARYRAEEADGEIVQDTLGSMHALYRGTPTRVYNTRMNANVLSFNGTDQHLLLDASIGDSAAMSFSVWCKLTARTAGAVLLNLGHRADEYIKIIPSNGSEELELRMRTRAGAELTVTSTNTIPLNEWVQIAFSTDGSTVRLYLNGSQTEQGTLAFKPYEMITPDLEVTGQANYIGRDFSGNYLAALVSDIQFYNTAMTTGQVAGMHNQYGRMLGRFYQNSTYTNGVRANTGISTTLEGTILAEVYPSKTDNVFHYRAIVDSWNKRGHYLDWQYGQGMPSIGVDDGKYVVMLNGVGRWNTGVDCPVHEWHKVALTYTQTKAELYVDGELAASKTAWQPYPVGSVYQIGGSGNGAVDDFRGQIRNVRILDKSYSGSTMARLFMDASPAGEEIDMDGDGLPDNWETNYFGNLSRDGTGDFDNDEVSDIAEYHGGYDPTDPNDPPPADSDEDGLLDAWEMLYFKNLDQIGTDDPDEDGFDNEAEETAGTDPTDPDITPDDTDGDGLADAWEYLHFGNLSQTGTDDPDGDGSDNETEESMGTDPNVPNYSGATISVNYDANNNGTPPMGVNDVAGVIQLANWNDINSAGAGGFLNPTQTFHDDSGDATTLGVSVSSGSPDSWNTTGTADHRLYGDFINAGAGTTLTLSSVPYQRYNLYVYHSHYAGNEVVDYTVGDETCRLTNSVGNPPSQSPPHIRNVTYVSFNNLTQSTVSVVAQTVSGNTGLAGFQIIENPLIPEPGVMGLIGLGLLGIAAYRRVGVSGCRRRLSL